MTRRLTIFLLALIPHALTAHPKVKLWNGVGGGPSSVTLEAFLPESGEEHAAVIICPGGSYCWHDYSTEGTEVAKWLSSNGIAAFVLNYRVQGVFSYLTHSRALFGGNQHPDMICDVQRAIQHVRECAGDYLVNPNKVGVMGFSAGGHLAMSAASFSHSDFLKPLGIITHVSLRPDFVAPVYPVVSMNKFAHKRSRRALLGERGKNDPTLREALSLERHIPEDCPPVFLVNCVDDPVVKYQNSVLLDSALTARGIPHKYIQYKTGGHGFGASPKKGTAECRQWKAEFLKWIKQLI